MKIVLVEDENKTRNGILHIIENLTDHEVIGTAENGAEGYEMVKELSPDLIISDIRMPVMDGLEMLAKLHQEKVKFNAILLTGYSDFEYARKALQLQVVDYLLKPLDVEEFLNTLNKIQTRISDTKITQVSTEQLLANYMEGTGEDQESVHRLLNEILHVNEKTEVSLFLLAPRRLFEDRLKEFVSCIKGLMESLCIENSYVMPVPGEKKILVVIAGTERNRTLKQRFQMRVLPELDDIGPCSCVYCSIHGIEDISGTVKEMMKNLSYGFSLPVHTIIDDAAIKSIRYESLEYPDHLENSLIREMRNGNKKKVADYGEQFIRQVAGSSAAPEMIREYALRFIANVLHAVQDMKEWGNPEENAQYFMERILSGETREEVKYQLEKFVHALVADSEEEVLTENGMIMNVISYIRSHYQEDITLSEAARICRVTPEYLSKIFYKEMGINFSPFLQNFRISIAKRMLLTGKHRVYEVAEAVGFHDQKYFIKVFKKICGVTPSEYRKESKYAD